MPCTAPCPQQCPYTCLEEGRATNPLETVGLWTMTDNGFFQAQVLAHYQGNWWQNKPQQGSFGKEGCQLHVWFAYLSTRIWSTESAHLPCPTCLTGKPPEGSLLDTMTELIRNGSPW